MQQEDDNKPTLLQKVVQLPDVIVDIIKEYIPKRVWAFTNRENYELYHKYLKPSINNYENYIRETIRRDNFFVFEKKYQLFLLFHNILFFQRVRIV